MVVVALLSVDLVESVDLVSVVLVVNCIQAWFWRNNFVKTLDNRSPMSKWQWTTLQGPASGSLRSLWIMDRPGNPGSTLPGMISTALGISMSELTCQSPGMTRSSARLNSQRFFPLKVERYLSGLRQVRYYKPSYLLSKTTLYVFANQSENPLHC